MFITNTTKIPLSYLEGFIHVEDLLYYDGPLVSIYRSKQDVLYLYVWVDVDKQFERMLIVELSNPDLDAYKSGKIALHSILVNAKLVYIAHRNNKGDITELVAVAPKDVPQEYMPDVDSFLV